MSAELDPIDHRLLDLLERDADRTAGQLAALLPLSASAIQRRIARLKREGVVERIVARVRRPDGPPPFEALVELSLASDRADVVDRFRRWASSTREVAACWYVTGEVDLVLRLRCRDIGHFRDFTEATLGRDPDIRRFRTLVVLDTLHDDRQTLGETTP